MNNAKLSEYQQRHERVLNDIITQSIIPATRIKEALTYAVFSGGKRFRPILVYLCGELFNIPLAQLDILAAAIELTHCYSLIHDDLPAMDNDDFRRGKPSCHRQFDEATAILVGDGLQALAIELLLTGLSDVPAETIIALTLELVRASGVNGMISGQSLDLSELCKTNLSENQLCTIHLLKTGKLILACINMVLALNSNPDEIKTKALNTFAQELGLVFQIQDDYLDAYASQNHSGKGRASDQANHKKTFASLYSQQELLQVISTHYQLAKEALFPFATGATYLIELLDYLQQRNHGKGI